MGVELKGFKDNFRKTQGIPGKFSKSLFASAVE